MWRKRNRVEIREGWNKRGFKEENIIEENEDSE